MKIELEKYCVRIIPENVQDEIYLETVLGLKLESSEAIVKRVNAYGLDCWAHAKIEKANHED